MFAFFVSMCYNYRAINCTCFFVLMFLMVTFQTDDSRIKRDSQRMVFN